jgi:hypothetical protein
MLMLQPPPPVTPPAVSYKTLTGPEIAYFGLWVSVVVAAIAALASLVVALVNAWAGRSLEKVKARREYRMTTLQPVVSYMDKVVAALEVVTFKIGANDDDLRAAAEAANLEVENGSAGMGMVSDTPRLKMKYKVFKDADAECFEILGKVDRRRAQRQPLDEVRNEFADQVNKVRMAAMDFRSTVEKFVF